MRGLLPDAMPNFVGGDERTRTADPLLAKQGAGDPLTCGFGPFRRSWAYLEGRPETPRRSGNG